MRPSWLRIPAGLAVLAAGFGAVALAWRTLFWWWSLAPMFFALLLVLLAPLAAWPLFAGRWARGAWAWPQQAAVCCTLFVYVIVALVALGRAMSALSTREIHATPTLVCAGWVALAAAAVLMLTVIGPSGCERFAFDRSAWKRDRAPVADALVRCRTLIGPDERGVQRLLGGRLGRKQWDAGYVDDGFFGARQRLSVRYGRDGRVRSARLDAFHI